MKSIRTKFPVVARHLVLVCAAFLSSVISGGAAPITIGTFEVQNDVADPFFTGPTFVVTNDSAFAGLSATFSDVHLLFGLDDLSTADFLLTAALGPGETIDSNGLADGLGQSLLPDLGTVLDAYLQLTLLDPLTSAVLSGTLSLVATDPALCVGCAGRMTDFAHGSMLAIQFDPRSDDGTPVPEPTSLFLVGSGVVACAVGGRWRSR